MAVGLAGEEDVAVGLAGEENVAVGLAREEDVAVGLAGEEGVPAVPAVTNTNVPKEVAAATRNY